jgi:hypothetical protein
MGRTGLIVAVVLIGVFTPLAGATSKPGPKTCVLRGSKLLGCVYRQRGEWDGNLECNNTVWGNRHWLWLDESASHVGAARRYRPGRWRAFDWSADKETEGYVVRRSALAWRVIGPNGRRVVALARGPDGPAAGLMFLDAGAACMRK